MPGLLHSTLPVAVLRMRRPSGAVAPQRVTARLFDGLEAKSLLLEALLPAHQLALAAGGGAIPPGHPAGAPVVVGGWDELVALPHSPAVVYQLAARLARTNAAYEAARALCAAAGSPFAMEHRVDPVDFKFAFRAADYELRAAFNARSAEKVPAVIHPDAMLLAPGDAALVTVHGGLSPSHVTQLAGTVAFLREWSAASAAAAGGQRHADLRAAWRGVLSRRLHLVAASSQAPPSRDLIGFARSKGVHLFARRGRAFAYCQ